MELEICPSKVRLYGKLTYQHLDELLALTRSSLNKSNDNNNDDNNDNDNDNDDDKLASNHLRQNHHESRYWSYLLEKYYQLLIAKHTNEEHASDTDNNTSNDTHDTNSDHFERSLLNSAVTANYFRSHPSSHLFARIHQFNVESNQQYQFQHNTSDALNSTNVDTNPTTISSDIDIDLDVDDDVDGYPLDAQQITLQHVYLTLDLARLNHYAEVRREYRMNRQLALDGFIQDKTVLDLMVKPSASGVGQTLTAQSTWANTSAICTVSELMILMSDAIGQWSVQLREQLLPKESATQQSDQLLHQLQSISLIYKQQLVHPPLSAADLQLQLIPSTSDIETPIMRTMRLLKHLRPANDTREPGYHATSGAKESTHSIDMSSINRMCYHR